MGMLVNDEIGAAAATSVPAVSDVGDAEVKSGSVPKKHFPLFVHSSGLSTIHSADVRRHDRHAAVYDFDWSLVRCV